MKIAIGCDHGGFVLKDIVKKAITDVKMQYEDYGTFSEESCDYPDIATKVTDAILSGKADKGILICGTGIGISISANKVHGIRCANVTDIFTAQMSAEHNNANIIALGGRTTAPEKAYEIVKTYLMSSFAGGRHQNRLDKITAIERESCKNDK